MKKKYRIKKSSEIEGIIKIKIFNKSKNMIVYINRKTQQDHFRYALSVGKKVGKAHIRNDVKRQLRDIISKNCDSNFKVDIFIIARPSILKENYEQLKNEFISSLDRLKLNGLVVKK